MKFYAYPFTCTYAGYMFYKNLPYDNLWPPVQLLLLVVQVVLMTRRIAKTNDCWSHTHTYTPECGSAVVNSAMVASSTGGVATGISEQNRLHCVGYPFVVW